ncbi:exodeoxyribonuclease III [Merdimmobilis hominis]|uniref:Exodeoxyribonuclease n=1 Tax=uncultured Anaerotruncus sp. TaxID=905011 RepID=A0A6N2U8Q2_9FIRM|nr:exodeoxyribonuclease III [Merdimmobilis hominis]MCD4835477.1 exodeoxyribonuclease III [Merdimmobilis hominis]PWL64843.1 MAG: exodeoxyribonuclease III [Oscillospiraceae bacterium]
MKLVSWNVNGLRACLGKGFLEFFDRADADAFCLQETKMQEGQADLELPGYTQYWNSAEKKGYSGTAVFTRLPVVSAAYGIGIPEHDSEGRVITLEFEKFYLVNVYTPNSQRDLVRIDYRMAWEDAFRGYLAGLKEKKPVVVCGDMNVARWEIDLKNPKSNRGNAGFSDQERAKMEELLASGFVDSFRYFYPEMTGAYTWWSYKYNSRANNTGWRIDYFLASRELESRLEDSFIYPEVSGSDHCPICLLLDL